MIWLQIELFYTADTGDTIIAIKRNVSTPYSVGHSYQSGFFIDCIFFISLLKIVDNFRNLTLKL